MALVALGASLTPGRTRTSPCGTGGPPSERGQPASEIRAVVLRPSERIRRKIDRRPAIEVRLSTASQPPHHCQGPVARHLPRHYLELLCSGRRGRRPWRRRATGGGEEGGSGRGGLGASGRAATLQHLPQQRLRSYPFKSPLALPVPPPVMGTNYSNWNRRRHPITGAPGWWWWWPPRGCSGVR